MSFFVTRKSAGITDDGQLTYVDVLYDFAGYLRANQGKLGPGRLAGKKIGIVGAGPAGLMAAYLLRKQEATVTIFEASERVGGRIDSEVPIKNDAARFELGAMRVPPSERLFNYLWTEVFNLPRPAAFPDPGSVDTKLVFQNEVYDWPAQKDPPSIFKNVPKEKFIFPADLPRTLAEEKKQAYAVNGEVPHPYAFFTGEMAPTKVTAGGSVKIVDVHNFPITGIAAAIVTVKPGGLRELHWHPNADEWQYYVKGTARMTIYAAAGRARTMDFLPGDVGYVDQSAPHYVENIGDDDLVFLEIFPTPEYQDISLAEWLAHTPSRLVDEHLGTGEDFLAKIDKKEVVITPEK